MDFTFNEEQSLIQDQVDQFVQKEYDWETRQSLSNSELGFGDNNWQKFAELGWLGISTSEDSGGFGGSAIELSLIHISEPTRHAQISYAVFCLKKKNHDTTSPLGAVT